MAVNREETCKNECYSIHENIVYKSESCKIILTSDDVIVLVLQRFSLMMLGAHGKRREKQTDKRKANSDNTSKMNK